MAIWMKDLNKEYGDVAAVKDLTLQIPDGVIFGLIGPNGAGKTTTFRMITGLLEPTSGSVGIDNIDVWKDPLSAFAKIGYLPDFFSLYENLKIWEYLDFFANSYKLKKADIPAKIDSVLSDVSLLDKKNEFISSLSRGMKQRLAIAKTVIHDPSLLILDEPAAGLDPIARQELTQTLLALNRKGKTIIISSHILSELSELCNYVGIMENGSLVKSGEIDSITKSENKQKKIEIEHNGCVQELKKILKTFPQISNIEDLQGKVVFDFNGDESDIVSLHRYLMEESLPIISFTNKKRDISDIFMEVSRKEAKK